ncbi:hypothetical protein [Sphingopyxis panaciterrae]
MITSRRLALIAGLALPLGACAGPAIPRPATMPEVVAPPPTAVKPVQNNTLIGSSADAIGRMFGKPRLDVTEGTGRKLQFAGSNCILDIYFYPPRAGAAPVATHVDARTPDGRNAEVNSCAQAFRR